ncbi:hypothetical protein [Paenibacillus sp. GCM10012303]|uniref:hypothetical protein n=1 Tax=Paenibacillus sp. GCM10012303 TaxID=3317340 RepID=UPI00360BDD5C
MIKKSSLRTLAVLLILVTISCGATIRNFEITPAAIGGQTEFLSDWYFDELDVRFEQIKEEHREWYLFDRSGKMAAQAVAAQMMDDLKNDPDALRQHKNFKRYFETFDRMVRKIGRISEELHYFRNTLNAYSNAPVKLEDMITLAAEGEWRLFSAKYHKYDFGGLNGAYNVKFVSADGRFEAVYNAESGEIVTDPVNMGTYNYAPGSIHPVKYYRHYTLDKTPWTKWGNTKEMAYRDIAALESKHGTIISNQNDKTVESRIQDRKSSRSDGNR